MTFGSFLARVSYGLGINPAAVPLFRRRFSKSFLPLIFHRPFACVSHGLGLNPSSFFMRSLGDVRQFSGSCFVQGVPVGQEKIIFSAPQGPPPRYHNEHKTL